MAGAVAELARATLARDFRHITPASARILLIEAAPRLLNGFPEGLGRYAGEALGKIGGGCPVGDPDRTDRRDRHRRPRREGRGRHGSMVCGGPGPARRTGARRAARTD